MNTPTSTPKTALITGASGGIGAAIATELDSQGIHVVLSGTNLEKLQTLAAKLSHAHVLPCALNKREERKQLIDKAAEMLGDSVDILINNAGLTRDNLFMRMDDDAWDHVLDVNLSAAFELSRAALKPMMKKKYGRIIMISSVTAHGGNAGQANYTASKAGMEAMAKSLAREVASRGITINCIAPGFIETPMTQNLDEQVKNAILAQIPQKRMGTPEDVAHAAMFLASAHASYITGETLHVNGGMFMS
jgi:3-oxoacyl-[acyl-carrier protein] reductase